MYEARVEWSFVLSFSIGRVALVFSYFNLSCAVAIGRLVISVHISLR